MALVGLRMSSTLIPRASRASAINERWALPRQRFGAHDCGGCCLGFVDQGLNRCLEFGGLHVVGVAAEGGVAPGGVDGIGSRVAEAA